MKVQYKKIADTLNHITGISSPVFGISWEPAVTEIHSAKQVIIFLEDKRVLYGDYHREYPPYVAQSIIEIRDKFTQEITKLPDKSELAGYYRSMRDCSIKFMTETDETSRIEHEWGTEIKWNDRQKLYFRSLGYFRVTMGYYISLICTSYGIDVDENLARILPASPNNDLQIKEHEWGS